MKVKTWFVYLFKDNERFWVCAKFYLCMTVCKFFNTNIGRSILKKMPRFIFDWFVIVNLTMISETIKFKIDKGDSA